MKRAPSGVARSHTKGRQKFLDSRYVPDAKIPEKATVAEAIDFHAMRVIERAADEPKLASAMASLVKRFDERTAGMAAKNELDRNEQDDNRIRYVTISMPNLPLAGPERPRPTEPTWVTKQKLLAGEYVSPENLAALNKDNNAPVIEVESISTNPKPETKE